MIPRQRLIERLRAADGWPVPVETAVRGARSDYDLNPSAAPGPKPLTRAAVLVPLIQHEGDWTVLLTQRTDHLQHHAGQISFPGGRAEEGDSGPVETALRESEEEIGLDPGLVEPIGTLDTYETVTGFLVVPVVGLVRPDFRLKLDSFEVAEAFEVPLAFVLDRRNHQRHSRERQGVKRHFYVLPYERRYIWGATAGMLVNLHDRLVTP
ncbi:MAG: CoA pyrophosphatase [Alphaproteobacteria bacterium]|nr:CoA pyrophosphatase [Alphaproteobacteria bacterium]